MAELRLEPGSLGVEDDLPHGVSRPTRGPPALPAPGRPR
jgi:hypothetical protein